MGKWYFTTGGKQQGPITIEQLRGLLGAGKVKSSDLVWTDSMSNWTPAGQVPELAAVEAAVPAGAASPAPAHASERARAPIAVAVAAPAAPAQMNPLTYATPSPRIGWSWGDFFAFRRMVTPLVIQVMFWVGVAGCFISGVIMMVGSFNVPTYSGGPYGMSRMSSSTQFSMPLFLASLLWICVGPLVVRIYCELLIVIFRVNETLTDIKQVLETKR